GAHQGAQKSTTTGRSRERSITSRSKSASATLTTEGEGDGLTLYLRGWGAYHLGGGPALILRRAARRGTEVSPERRGRRGAAEPEQGPAGAQRGGGLVRLRGAVRPDPQRLRAGGGRGAGRGAGVPPLLLRPRRRARPAPNHDGFAPRPGDG